MKKIINYLIYVLFIIFVLWSIVFISFQGALSDRIEPAEIGINIQKIKNASNKEVIFINIFENNFDKIKSGEEKILHRGWLPAADYKILSNFLFLFKIPVMQGSILHPEDRCCIVITKSGMFTLSMGRFHSFKTEDDKYAQVWVRDDQGIVKTIEGYSLVEKISSTDDGNRNLIINNEGLLQMQLAKNPDLKKAYPILFSKPVYSNFEWYEYKLKQKNITLPGKIY